MTKRIPRRLYAVTNKHGYCTFPRLGAAQEWAARLSEPSTIATYAIVQPARKAKRRKRPSTERRAKP